MNKKGITVVLILILTMLVFSACTDNAVNEVVIGEYYDDNLGVTYSIYKVTNNDTEAFYAKVSSVIENARNPEISITIPATITYQDVEYKVTTIGNLAFYKNNYDIINIPEGVTTIEKFAFDRAKATRIDLPSTVTFIGEYAFFDCNSLQDIYLYASVPPALGSYAFMFFDQNTNTYIASSIMKIHVPANFKNAYTDINTYPDWEIYQGNIR